MEDDERVKTANKWLENISKGITSHQLEALSLDGLKIVHSHEGFILCNFVVSNRITDGDGNWKVGAMATLIDDVGAAAIYSLIGHIKVSLDFNISYYSTAKTQEEVEIEAKVVGEKGKLMSVVTEVRKKDNGQLIALGRQWMASSNVTSKAKNPQIT
ncbi:acyl-CoA thioesterase, putative [Ricinus communis]|uniref:Acyl-coenzyme A thioesterase 13 n=1 Tax=Ricinus communis TaxID=3988 RepID=B9RQJ7_RICCO|nr:acyl-CoA thioesterase, putative [Ricinus communis]